MSFVVTTPEVVAAAAGDLVGIGSALEQAAAAAAIPTTNLPAAAADEVSVAVSQLFDNHGRHFQAVNAQVEAFRAKFVQLLSTGAATYLDTDVEAAARNLAGTVTPPAQALLDPPWNPSRLLPIETGGAYGELVEHTVANLQSLGVTWSQQPFPFLRQLLVNQQGYLQGLASAFPGFVQNLPANVANLPATVAADAEGLLTFDWSYYTQNFVATQNGLAQTFATSSQQLVTSLAAGLPKFSSAVNGAIQVALTGQFEDAAADAAQAYADLLVTGFDTSNVTVGSQGFTLLETAYPVVRGPLGDFFTIMNLPGQEAQFMTNLMPPSTLRQIAQTVTNGLNALTLPSITAQLAVPIFDPLTATVSTFFGLPLVVTYAAVGAPFSALYGLATSAEIIYYAIPVGDIPTVLSTLIDAPAVALDGFLNESTIVNNTVLVPTGFSSQSGFPETVSITLHVPFDGILVPPHPVTATVGFPGTTIPIPSFDVDISGTPFAGMVPLLVNYIPQQLALAIQPAA